MSEQVKIYYNDKEHILDGDRAKSIIDILNSNEFLNKKTVNDFDGYSFYVKDYQRGYRWGEEEIKYLLDDIAQFKESDGKYCMQPIVVKQIDEKSGYSISDSMRQSEIESGPVYELIDGQQRLTTLYFILLSCGNNPKYNIYYQLLRSLDNSFIRNAKRIIKEYLNKNEVNGKDLSNKILNSLVFIWYEIENDNQSSNEKFSQINKGKIELTNAELFKALLLNLPSESTAEDKTASEKIAFEWDKIEHGLNNDAFWFFISNNSDERNTRIDYILELYAKKLEKAHYNKKNYSDKKDRYSYNVVRDYIEEVKKGSNVLWEEVVKVWEEIVAVYDKLYSWYCDNELYNNIGFLVACENKGRSACVQPVVDLYLECYKDTLSRVRKNVEQKVKTFLLGKGNDMLNAEDVLSGKSYDNSELSDLRSFLLYSNIYYVQYYNKNTGGTPGRFSFKDYYKVKSWDIEHINPQTPQSRIEEEVDNTITNLVLLDLHTNREYHNEAFNVKRSYIIDIEKEGRFILPCTRSVFLKYFTEEPKDFTKWDNFDADGYEQFLTKMVNHLMGKKDNE